MNALRNIFSSRTLTYLRQNGQNALINLTQPDGGGANGGTSASAAAATAASSNEDLRPAPLLIPKSILDATTFKGKKFGPVAAGSISPTTLKRYRRMERKVELVYRCTICDTRNHKTVTEAAYTTGVVILQCDGCSVDHLIIDNLGWFANTKGKSFDQVLAEKGDKGRVRVIKVDQFGELI